MRTCRWLARGGKSIDAGSRPPRVPDDPAYRLTATAASRVGLVTRAAASVGLDLARSVVVGDRWSDIGLARAVGAAGLLVETGAGAREALRPVDGLRADAVLPSLAEAASWILRERR
jgi:D-glycero-D-manno-heptose 1,7-bisphosphate phosphatase